MFADRDKKEIPLPAPMIRLTLATTGRKMVKLVSHLLDFGRPLPPNRRTIDASMLHPP
jgi:hypothetical protein